MTQSEKERFLSRVREDEKACADFWVRHAADREHGGIWTCLDREGNVYDTDKSVWFQGRAPWVYCALCRRHGIRPEWLSLADSCLTFAEKYCFLPDGSGRMYYSVTADGRPLTKHDDCFSESFYCMACAEYYGLTGDAHRLAEARRVGDVYWNYLLESRAGTGPKGWCDFGTPMIFLNVLQILARTDPERKELYCGRMDFCAEEMLRKHWHPELGCTLENVFPDGSVNFSCGDGRTVNPGHDIEGAWFLLEYAALRGRPDCAEAARRMFDAAFAMGDAGDGSLFLFADAQGKPVENPIHLLKIWWPQCEVLIASLMLWRSTGETRYLDIFRRSFEWSFRELSDQEYGEWYAFEYPGTEHILETAKGTGTKGPFHVLRMLMRTEEILETL